MTLPVWIDNLFAYCLQIAILTSVGTLLVYLFRLRMPQVTLLYWQGLLLACLLLPFLQPWRHEVISAVSIGSSAFDVSSAIPVEIPVKPAAPVLRIPWEGLGLVLAAGIFLRLVWLLIGFVRLRYLRRKACLFLEDQAVVRELQWRTGVRVSLLISDDIDSPVTFGFRMPTVILPLSFRELSEPCQKAVLCHELLHVRRLDWILILVEEVVRSIFWFHPAVWWLINRIHLCREQVVDQEVVQITGSKQPYLDSLLEFARALGRPRAVPAPLFIKERHLVQRVALLIREVSMSRSRLAVSIIAMFVLMTAAFHTSAGWFPLTGAPVLAQEPNDTLVVNAPQRNPIRVGGKVMDSRLIRRVDPVYPEAAKRARIQGVVVLTVHVNEEGFVYDATVVKGHPLLNQAAVDAVKQWQYSPTLLNGQRVPIIATVSVVFNLKGNNSSAQLEDPSTQPGSSLDASVAPSSGYMAGQFANPDATPPRRTALRVGGDIQESKLIYKVNPVYPEEAKADRLEGTVILQVTVNEEGLVSGIIASPGNYQILEEAAIDAVRQWKYSPTLLNGEPVPVFATVTVVFNLGSPDDLWAALDESGNLTPALSQILQTSGTVHLRIAPTTPFPVVERTIQDLLQKGVQKLKLSGPFVLYQGKVFYSGTLAVREGSHLDMNRLFPIMRASGQVEKGKRYRLNYRLYLNEAGEPVGLQRLGGIEVREIEDELMRMNRAPAVLESTPVPYMCPIEIEFIV